MKTITLYSTSFRNYSEWEYVLSELGVPKEEWEDIDQVELDIEDFTTF
jgi:hypothetical protein